MIILCGKTCSGKNYIRDELVKQGIEPVVTYTTRPMREGEVQGVTYNFLSNEDFQNKLKENFFVEAVSYEGANGQKKYYGSHFSKEDNNKVIILNRDGVDAVRNSQNLNVIPVVFYLDVPNEILKTRSVKRGDDPKEVDKRLKIDDKDFAGIEKKVDAIIKNTGELSAQEIAERVLLIHSEVLENYEKMKGIKGWEPELNESRNAKKKVIEAGKPSKEEKETIQL